MSEDKSIFDKFVFIIVDADEFFGQARSLLLKEMGISPVCISYGNLRQKTSEIVQFVYNEKKYPIIFLGESGSHFSETSDTLIVEDLVRNFKQGGILIPSSSNFDEQRNNWRYFIPEDENNWRIPETYNVDIESECKNFLENILQNREESIESRNK